MTILKNFKHLGTISTETDFVLFGTDYTSNYSNTTFSSWFVLPKTFVKKSIPKTLSYEIEFGEIEGKHSDVYEDSTTKEESFLQTISSLKELDDDIETIKFQNIVHFFDEFCGSDDWSNFTKDQLEIFDEVIELQEFLHNYSTDKSVSLTVTIPEEEILIFKKMMKKHPKWKIEE